jgi:hypothetical protein
MAPNYEGTAIDFSTMSSGEIRDLVAAGSATNDLQGAADLMAKVAEKLTAACDDLHQLHRDYSSAHEGAAADATRDYLVRLAEPGLIGVGKFNLASTALQDQSTYFAKVTTDVAGQQDQAAVSHAATVYQDNTNHNLANWFQVFPPPTVAQPDSSIVAGSSVPDWPQGSGGADRTYPAPEATAVAGASGLGGPEAAGAGAVGAPGASSGVPGSGGAGAAVPPALAVGAAGTGSAAPGGRSGGSPTSGAGLGDRVSTLSPSEIDGAQAANSGSAGSLRTPAPSADGVSLGAPGYGGGASAFNGPGVRSSAGRTGWGTGEPEVGAPGTRGPGSGHPPGAGTTGAPGGRFGSGLSSEAVRGGATGGEGALQPRGGSGGSGGAMAEEAARSASPRGGGQSGMSHMPFMAGGPGSGGGGEEHARPVWLVEDDPESVWLSGLPPHGPGVIRPG